MSTNRLIETSLFFSTLLSGFYGGMGFFVAIGMNPALRLMSDRTFAEYWQHTDYFMAARMKIFGPLLLLSILLSGLVLLKEKRTAPFWFMLAAFILLITDLVFTLSTNHPLNQLVQTWDLNNLPSDVPVGKRQIIAAFNTRLFFLIATFTLVLLAVVDFRSNNCGHFLHHYG